MEAIWFKSGYCLGLTGELPIVVCLSLGRWNIPNRLQQSDVVESVHPFKGGQFHGFLGFPGSTAVNQFGLVQPIDCLGQGVVVTVATTAHRRFYPGLGEALGVKDGAVY